MKQSSMAGILIMMAAATLFGCSDIGIKVFGEKISPWQITAGRGLLGMAVILICVKFNFRIFMVRHWPVQLGLGVAGALGFTFFIISIKYLPLSIAMPLAYIYPAIGALLSPLINKEKPNKGDWTAIALALVAIICLSQGASSEPGQARISGFVFGVVGAFFVALMANLARRQTQGTLLSVNLFYVYFANFIVCLPLIILMDNPVVPPTAELGKLFLIIAPPSVLGFCLMFLAYKSINAFRGATIMMLEAAVASSYGVIMLGEPLTTFMIIGGILMITSAIIIARSGGNLPSGGNR